MPARFSRAPVFRSDAQELNGKSFELAGLSGREGISELFEFTIDLRPSEEVSVTSLDEFNLLCESTAHLAFGYEYDQRIFGVVRRVQMLPSTNREGTPYRLSLVPRLWDATLTVRSRVFQDLSVRQIVEAILKETGLVEGKDYVFHLETDYSAPEYKRQYTVQYEESNYEFISRLMEHEGIFFFFRHDAGRDILVIADSNSAFEELPGDSTLFFNSEGASTELREEVTSIDCTVRVLPNQVYVREYNWRSPRLLVHAKADIGLKKKPEDKNPQTGDLGDSRGQQDHLRRGIRVPVRRALPRRRQWSRRQEGVRSRREERPADCQDSCRRDQRLESDAHRDVQGSSN